MSVYPQEHRTIFIQVRRLPCQVEEYVVVTFLRKPALINFTLQAVFVDMVNYFFGRNQKSYVLYSHSGSDNEAINCLLEDYFNSPDVRPRMINDL